MKTIKNKMYEENKNIKKSKKKSRKLLTLRNRIDIEREYFYGASITNIAQKIKKNKGTVSREIGGKPRKGFGRYKADKAHSEALERISKRGNKSIIENNSNLKKYIVKKLKIGWSPEQISIRLPLDYKDNQKMRISYEAIYQFIYNQITRKGHGKLKENCEDLRIYLTRRHKRRQVKNYRKIRKAWRKENIPSIDDRPKIIELRSRVGDWEDDFIVSRQSNICIKSVNERKTGVVFFGKTKDRKAQSGDDVLLEKLSKIPAVNLKSLTRDNGSENKDFKRIEKELNLKVYFAHPYHS